MLLYTAWPKKCQPSVESILPVRESTYRGSRILVSHPKRPEPPPEPHTRAARREMFRTHRPVSVSASQPKERSIGLSLTMKKKGGGADLTVDLLLPVASPNVRVYAHGVEAALGNVAYPPNSPPTPVPVWLLL